jgi:transposase
MADILQMNSRERRRMVIMDQVLTSNITLKRAAKLMQVSYRQAKRIKRSFLNQKDAGLIHKNRGKKSNNKKPDAFREVVLDLYRKDYPDFGPTFAAEKLLERGYRVDHETLRRWLVAAGLWERKRRRKQFRQRREPKHHFGELIQVDGSHHHWFEDRGPSCCLMHMVDDATGVSYFFFSEQETKKDAMALTWGWICKYGIPESLYCDRKNVYLTDREPNLDEQLAGIDPKNDFEKACEKLGIEIITAYSPQAKGRVERKHGVLQDRLVKELRLANISTIEEANLFVQNGYMDSFNKKFARQPVSKEDRHVALFSQNDLRKIFVFESERRVANDWIIQFNNRLFQIQKNCTVRPQPRDRVLIHEWLDGSLHFIFNDKELNVEEFGVQKNKEETARAGT